MQWVEFCSVWCVPKRATRTVQSFPIEVVPYSASLEIGRPARNGQHSAVKEFIKSVSDYSFLHIGLKVRIVLFIFGILTETESNKWKDDVWMYTQGMYLFAFSLVGIRHPGFRRAHFQMIPNNMCVVV